MSSVGALILVAIVGALICAKARVAGGAMLFSLVGLALFVSTPAGDGLPAAVAEFVATFDDAATPVLSESGFEGSEAVG